MSMQRKGKRPRRGTNARIEAAIASRRRDVAKFYLRGWAQQDIAAKLEVDRTTVYRDLCAIHAEWREHRIADMDQLKAAELERIASLEREAWEAWERSKMPVEDRRVGRSSGQQGSRDYVEQRTLGGCGNPKFLAVAMQCVERRCRLLGLDAPQKIAPTDPSGDSPWGVAAEGLTDEQLEALAALGKLAAKATQGLVPGSTGHAQPRSK